ncbi:MAG: hypothetical protein HY066_11445 [Betaproteobacteria bacterium]|nr:hypothetical protein [Betaproteobacteria bacterium]
MSDLTARLRALEQVGLMPVSEIRNQQTLWAHIGVLVGLVALVSALLLTKADIRQVLLLESMVVFTFAIWWWASFVSGVLRQCTPINLQLTPSLAGQVRQAATALWTVESLALAMMMALQFGNFVTWWIVTALVMLVLAWLIRLPRLAIFMIVFPALYFVGRIRQLDFKAPDASMLTLSVLAILVFAAFTFARLFDLRGERGYRVQKRMSDGYALRHGGTSRQPVSDLFSTLTSGRPLYVWLLKRALAAGMQPERLLVFVFGPKAHWGNVFWGLFISCLTMIPLWAALLLVNQGLAHGLIKSLMFPLGIMLFAQTALQPMLLPTTRREQRLLLLAPGAPQGKVLNRIVAQIILRLFPAYCLGFLTIFAIPLGLLNSRDNAFSLFVLATALVGGLFGLGIQLKNYAYLKSRPEFDVREVFMQILLALVLIAPLAFAGYMFGSAAYLELLAGYFLSALLFVVLRWRRMINGSAVLPAGRLVDD